MDTINISAVTHCPVPCCYVEFSSDFSSDAAIDVIEDSKFKKQEFFDDLIAFAGSAGAPAEVASPPAPAAPAP